MGANTGAFSTIATELGLATIAWDIDPAAVEKAYLANKDSGKPLLPLTLDLTNPSPNIGWNLEERHGWTQRGKPDVVMALALIHHLAIGNNTPLSKVAEQFAELAEWAIVEFVPKSDSQVQRMLGSRKDVFDDYTEDGFVQSFDQNFNIIKSERVLDSDRTLYLLQRRS